MAVETWAEKAERLARERLELAPDPFTASRKQQQAYRAKRDELAAHLRNVPRGAP